MRGGVSALAIFLLALSLTFTACSDGGDDNSISNPSPTLPGNEGDNPVDEVLGGNSSGNNEETSKTITLSNNDYSDYTLKLNNDGTAIQYDKGIPDYEFSYTYNANKNELYMRLEKIYVENAEKWCNFDDCISRINESYTIDNIRKDMEEYFNEHNNEAWFEQEYPNCTTYKEYEKFRLEEMGFDSLDEMANEYKHEEIEYLKIEFGILTTYNYNINNGKMTLTEKFTGLKNVRSNLEYQNDDIRIRLFNESASLRIYDMGDEGYYYSETFDNGKIVFFNEDNKNDKITATYKEDIESKKVTVTIKDGDYRGTYPCEFEGVTYTQK